MSQGYEKKFERMGIEQVQAAIPTMRRPEKLAAKKWLEERGIEISYDEQQEISRERRIAGAEMIVQMVRDLAAERGIALHEVTWAPDPAKEAEGHSSDTYTLVVTVGQKVAHEAFSPEDLEDTRGREQTQKRVRTTLEGVLERLEFEELL
jgi:hypothetical protein